MTTKKTGVKKLTSIQLLTKTKNSKRIAVDTETTGVDRSDHAFCISATIKEKSTYHNTAIVHDEINKLMPKIKAALENKNNRIVFHNARFDLYHLNKLGIKINLDNIDDTMILAHIIHPDKRKKLKVLSDIFLPKKLTAASKKMDALFEDMDIKDFASIEINLLKEYAEMDTEITLRLMDYFIKEIKKMPETRQKQIRYLYKLELKTLKILYEIETTGIYIDKKGTLKLKDEYQKEVDHYKNIIMKVAYVHKMDVNPNSDDDMVKLLEATGFDMKLLSRTYKTNKYSMNSDDLKLIAHHDKTGLVNAISKHNHFNFQISTYIKNFLKGEKVKGKPDLLTLYPKFSQTVTQTGRFSSFDPNFQNLTRGPKIRSLIVAPKDYYIVSFDYKQIEPKIAAHLSKDYKMSSVFIEGRDIYNATGSQLYSVSEDEIKADNYGKRMISKEVVLGVMFSMGPLTMSKTINKKIALFENANIKPIAESQCKIFIDKFFKHYSVLNRYKWTIYNFAKRMGYVLNMYGRMRVLESKFAYRGLNTIVQGTTADFIRYKMCKIDKYIKDSNLHNKARFILQVHDELNYYIHKKDAPKIVPIIRDIMCDADAGVCEISVPLGVDIDYGDTWGTMKEWDL